MTDHVQDKTIKESQVTNPSQWNTALARLPTSHVLQTWEWGAFKSRYGWRPTRVLWSVSANGYPLAAASVLIRSLARLPAKIAYVPKGPALNYGDTGLLERVLARLEDTARQKSALFIKIDPDVWADTAEGRVVVETLQRRGWRPSPEQIQFRNTVLLDLNRPPDDILAGMKSKWRYNVRLAGRKGVTVRRGNLTDLPMLYDMYAETASRGEFVIRSEGYYRDAWSTFIKAGSAQPLIAEVEDEPVAMVVLFHFAGRAWYMYGASRSVHREKMPNHLLQWEAIRWAQEHGCAVYDMWGAPDEMEESDPLWGVYRFKKGFGGEFVRHIGAWDYPVSRLGYWLYTKVMDRVLAVMHWRYWRRQSAARSADNASS